MTYDPHDKSAGTHIRSLIRRGGASFEEIVEELEREGFIDHGHEALPMMRPGFNSFDSEEFEILFEFFFPERENDMKVLSLGLRVEPLDDIIYVLYDANQLSSDELAKKVEAKFAKSDNPTT